MGAAILLLAVMAFFVFAIWKLPEEHVWVKWLIFGYCLFLALLLIRSGTLMAVDNETGVEELMGSAYNGAVWLVVAILSYFVIGFVIHTLKVMLGKRKQRKYGGESGE